MECEKWYTHSTSLAHKNLPHSLPHSLPSPVCWLSEKHPVENSEVPRKGAGELEGKGDGVESAWVPESLCGAELPPSQMLVRLHATEK